MLHWTVSQQLYRRPCVWYDCEHRQSITSIQKVDDFHNKHTGEELVSQMGKPAQKYVLLKAANLLALQYQPDKARVTLNIIAYI